MPTSRDLGWREIAMFAPLVVLTILFGVYPKPVLDMSAASVTALLAELSAAALSAAAKSAALGELMTAAATDMPSRARRCRRSCWRSARWRC